MELTSLVAQYVRERDSFVVRIGRLSAQLDAWTDEHSRVPPNLIDIAQFEGLRAERSQLLADFEAAENRFVVTLLENVKS